MESDIKKSDIKKSDMKSDVKSDMEIGHLMSCPSHELSDFKFLKK